jgi:hypothetical protein
MGLVSEQSLYNLAEHLDELQAYEAWQRSSARNPAVGSGLGCLPGPRSPHRSSVREPVTSWTTRCMTWS